MTHLNFKFLVVCLVVVASVVGLQAQNDVPIRGKVKSFQPEYGTM